MTDIVERLRAYQDRMGVGQLLREEAAAELERLRALSVNNAHSWDDIVRERDELRAALQALHDWYVEYARINNLFNADGSPATFHELLEARRALEPKP